MEPRRWEEIESAFRELVALDGVAQRERLAALGATDPVLRAAVEKLLAADAEAEQRLAPIAASLVGPGADPLDQLAAALTGHYRVERELGHGGMATVYLAHDLKHDRAVALKVLKPELAAALGRERFLREVALTARLDHPHIVPLLDSGEAGGRSTTSCRTWQASRCGTGSIARSSCRWRRRSRLPARWPTRCTTLRV